MKILFCIKMSPNEIVKNYFSVFKKLNYFFNSQQKVKILALLILLFIGMLLEVMSLSLVIPMISSILDPEFKSMLTQFGVLKPIVTGVSQKNLILSLMGVLITVFFIKSVFLIYLNYRQNRFIGNVSSSVSNNLFQRYLGADYYFHLTRNSAELMRNIKQEVSFFTSFFQSVMNVIVETMLLLAVAVTLVLIEPLGAISLGLFLSIVSYLFFQLTQKKLLKWGKKRQELDGITTKVVLEMLAGIKEIKLLGKELYFQKKFSSNNNENARIQALFTTVNLTPRYFLEFMSIFALVSFIVIMLLQNKPIASLVSVVGVFVAAVFRMLPSINKIISSLQVIKYKKIALDVLIYEFKSIEKVEFFDVEKISPIQIQKSFGLKSFDFGYNNQSKIFDQATIEIKKGEVIGIIGKSGAGKSTLVDILLGLYPSYHKHFEVNGTNFKGNISSLQKQIGYVPQNIFLTDDTIMSNIALGVVENEIDLEQLKKVIALAQLRDLVKSLPNGIKAKVGENGEQLSGGQRQRIGIARALYHNPEIIIFDEATSALDHQTEKDILDVIFSLKKEKTILMVAHRLSTLEKCDAIYEIKQGQIRSTNLNSTLDV